MTHAIDALEALKAAIEASLGRADLPEISASRKAVVRLGAAEAAPTAPQGPILEALRRRLLDAYRKEDARSVDWRDLRDAPWVLWGGEFPLAPVKGIADDVYQLATEHQRTLRNLIEAWINCFTPDGAGISKGGERIRALLALHDDMRLDQWRDAQRRVSFFEPKVGPLRVATWLLDGPEPVAEVLQHTGLADPLRGAGGYAKAVQVGLIGALPVRLRDNRAQSSVERGTDFLVNDGRLRFPELRGPMAAGLVSAWFGAAQPPADTTRRNVLEFLLRYLGDPRLRPANWIGAGEEAVALVRRWLTRASLEAFFDLISDHAHDAHWKWRKAFWNACMEHCNSKNIPFDAWLALGPRIHASARAVGELGGAYAQLNRSNGVQPDHAVLLMMVGPLVLCEWSHSGKLRAWMSDGQTAPKLYKREYERSELVRTGLPFPPNITYGSKGQLSGDGLTHFSSDRGYWQGSAAELLARRAGVKLTHREWYPR